MNSLLIYLIRTKTAAGMEIYKKLLYMSCFMDLIVSFWTFIVQPIPVISHGYRTVLMNGIFRKSSQPIRYAVYLIWVQMLIFFLITTITQYAYRFCILCRNGVVSLKFFGWMTFGQTCLFFAHGYLLAWADYPREGEKVFMKEIREKIMEESGLTDVEFISFVNAALLPTFEAFGWGVQTFLPVFVTERISTVIYTVFTDIPIHLIPALNPIGTILLVAPYRYLSLILEFYIDF
ncbi:unnamed protein product [Meloidogyne enterolobii]|uniref:Uncharacterized protein n=1 Tax=Meloidogyne enterolobii TaxID=390850 RepID=A0ACB0Y9J8_MELEN